MTKHKLIVFTNPVEGEEEQFNEWYMNTHMPDVLKVPGFISGQRFTWAHAQAKEHTQTWRYMTVLEIETENLRYTLDDLMSRAGTPAMKMSTSLADYRIAYVFTEATPPFSYAPNGGLQFHEEASASGC